MRGKYQLGAGICLCGLIWAHGTLQAAVVTYPAPGSESLSTEYEVVADGKPVDVYTARVLDPPFAGKQWDFGGPYAFANFDVAGRVTVKIRAKRFLRNTVIPPAYLDMRLQVEDEHTVSITFGSPRKISVEPDGRKGPLLLFANPMEQ